MILGHTTEERALPVSQLFSNHGKVNVIKPGKIGIKFVSRTGNDDAPHAESNGNKIFSL